MVELKSQLRKKDIYFNGHEREDVVEYRNIFLNKMLQYENFMSTFEKENMKQQNLLLLFNEKLHILIIHDECIFYVNNNRPIIWAHLESSSLRKKDKKNQL